ncbi:MAG: hypothetical protein H6907_17560 [Hyphomicrobiales bacterium]|nr:hypothetical protein [Hyphomicrobiales bacterium]
MAAMEQSWIDDLAHERALLERVDRAYLGGMEVVLRGAEAKVLAFARRHLRPLLTEQPVTRVGAPAPPCTIALIYSDDLVDRAAADCLRHPLRRGPGGMELRQVDLHDGRQVLIDGAGGLIWCVDPDSREVALIHASRAMWPALHLADTVREVAVAYLEEQGWTGFRACAVAAPDGVFLGIADTGTGKTSMTAALLNVGCAFVADGHCYVRRVDDRLLALGLPQPVNIPLGVVRLHAGLKRVLLEGEAPIHPRQRLIRRRVAATAEDKWPDLPDELQLMPAEFSAAMGAPPPWQGGPVLGLVRPSVALRVGVPIMRALAVDEVRGLMDRTRIAKAPQDTSPPWLDLGFRPAAWDPTDILRLPAIEFAFHVTENGIHGLPGPVEMLKRALDSVDRRGGLVGQALHRLDRKPS